MKYLKSLAITTMALTGFVGLGAGITHAAPPTTDSTNRMNEIMTAIAQKFNLNEADVQNVFDTEHIQMNAERMQEQQAQFKSRLDQAIKDGKLTQAQEDLLIAKQAELKAFMDTLKDKTPIKRQTAMKAQRRTLKTWATANNIPKEYSFFGDKHHGFGGPRGDEGIGDKRRGPKERLTQAVTDGKLTQAQANAITTKLTEQKAFLATLKGKTRDERDAAIKTQREALTQWASANTIPTEYSLFPTRGHRERGMMGGRGRGHINNRIAPATSS